MVKLLIFLSLTISSLAELSLIPKPVSVKEHPGKTLELSLAQPISLECPAEFKASLEAGLTKFKFSDIDGIPALLVKKDSQVENPEGYKLVVDEKQITITAKTQAGVYYATQTLLQLMDASIYSDKKIESVKIPCVNITDSPNFGWRGLMLDSSRHFQTIPEIKRFIDNMAAHKLNVFHWHLTDGHGWRFESKKYPNLTKRGSWRIQPGYPTKGKKEKYGGFYTQKEMKDIVAYAKVRGVTVVPEIDMPGHCFAWVASYPKTGCLEKPQGSDFFYTYPADAQRFPGKPGTDVLCVGKDEVITMCKDILDELMEIFPSQYIHIGGDEVNKKWWKGCKHCQARKKEKGLKNEHELQSWFIKQLDSHITKSGRRMIGWDEILEGGLAKNATVMSWQGEKGGIKAAKMGHDVVMSPQTYIYLDHGQSHSPLEPPHWPGHKPLDRAYGYNPIPASLTADEAKHILGVQGNVWTIFTHAEWLIDICTWPRAAAIAEVGWTARSEQNWDDFYARLSGKHRERLDAMGINYWWEQSADIGVWDDKKLLPDNKPVDWKFDVTSKINQGQNDFTFHYTKGSIGLNIQQVTLLENGKEIAIDKHDGFTGSKHENNVYKIKLPKLDPKATYTLTAKVSGSDGVDSYGTIKLHSVETKVLKKLPYE